MAESGAGAGPRFSVVIVNYNGAETLVAAIRSAIREGVAGGDIIVVDNGSDDASLAEAELTVPQIVVIRNGCNAGFARAANRGLALARREFVLLLNNDAVLEPGALAAFTNAFAADPQLAIAGGQLRYPDRRLQSAFAPLPTLTEEIVPLNFLKWLQPGRYVRSTQEPGTRVVESVFGACLAVRNSALATIGALDEEFFFYFEEVEWCRRARLRGWSVAFVAEARATHVLGHTANQFRSDARVELQRSKLLYFRKFTGATQYLALSTVLVVRTGINALAGALLCVMTLFTNTRLRRNTRAYWRMFAWHLLGRPDSWGLPGKCAERPASGERIG